MTAAYRLRGIGWFALVAAVTLGFYLVSLRVAAERKRLDGVNGRIELAEREIRALETEFDTRANMAQLEKWNGDTLALNAPTAQQFVRGDAELAALDPQAPGAPLAPGVKAAALVVPSLPEAPPAPVVAPATPVGATAVAARQPVNLLPAGFARTVASAPAGQPVNLVPAALFRAQPVAPTGRNAPALARAAEAARGAVAVARVRPQAVAMLDRKLLSDTTFGDLVDRAQSEARGR